MKSLSTVLLSFLVGQTTAARCSGDNCARAATPSKFVIMADTKPSPSYLGLYRYGDSFRILQVQDVAKAEAQTYKLEDSTLYIANGTRMANVEPQPGGSSVFVDEIPLVESHNVSLLACSLGGSLDGAVGGYPLSCSVPDKKHVQVEHMNRLLYFSEEPLAYCDPAPALYAIGV